MAKPPTTYGLKVKLNAPAEAPELTRPQPELSEAAGRRRPMETRSDPTIVYLHPDGKYELKRYALAQGPKVKVHDLLIEAIQEWAERKGLAGPFRVQSERQRKT